MTGDAERGVALLTDLYIDTNDPNYIFNQGRCFEQNRRYEDAIGRFREYLFKAKNIRSDDRAEAERHIAACESYVKSKPIEAAKPEAPIPTNPEPPKPPVAEPAPQAAPEQEIVAIPESSSGGAGSGLRVAGLATGALGVAGLVTGLVLNLKANKMSYDVEDQYDPGVDSKRKDYKRVAKISYGVGAACMAGGALLYSLGWWRGSQTSSVSVLPVVGPDMAGSVLLGVF